MFCPLQWKLSPSLKLIRPSWYNHPLARYSVLLLITLRDFVTLTLISGHTWRVTYSTPPPSLKILCLELWVLISLTGYHWHCLCGHCACAIQWCHTNFPRSWNPWPWFVYSLCNLYGSKIKINWVIPQNSVKDHIAACAKLHQPLTGS